MNRKRNCAPLLVGGSEARGKATAAHNKAKAGRRELQGIAPGRNPDQAAPTWPEPPGATAAADLARALRQWTLLLGEKPRDPRNRS